MKLSIITVNLNNVEGLRKTIDSVVNQTWQEFEWIIVDGGSTDGSKELIEETARQLDGHGWDTVNFSLLGFTAEGWKKKAYPVPPEGKESVDSVCNEEGITVLPINRGSGERVFLWTSEPDNGIYNAMNKGIVMAQGEYCLFLNSGDRLYNSDVLRNVFDNGLDKDIVYGYVVKKDKLDMPLSHMAPEEISLNFLLRRTISHQSCFIKKNLLYKYGGYDENLRIASDWKLLFISIGLNNATYKNIKEIISVYESNGISSDSDKLSEERKFVLENLFPLSMRTDYVLVDSLSEVLSVPFCRFLYSILYRVAVKWRKIFDYCAI